MTERMVAGPTAVVPIRGRVNCKRLRSGVYRLTVQPRVPAPVQVPP